MPERTHNVCLKTFLFYAIHPSVPSAENPLRKRRRVLNRILHQPVRRLDRYRRPHENVTCYSGSCPGVLFHSAVSMGDALCIFPKLRRGILGLH